MFKRKPCKKCDDLAQKIRDIHVPMISKDFKSLWCLADGKNYPCRTIRVLDGEQ